MRNCRIMPRPWGIPTLPGHPPPVPAPPRPVLPANDLFALPLVPAFTPPARRRRRNDCLFLPDMDVALQFLQARQRVGAGPHLSARWPAPVEAAWDPWLAVAVGVLLLVLPPVAVTLVWTHPRFGSSARIALTAFASLVTVALTLIALAALL